MEEIWYIFDIFYKFSSASSSFFTLNFKFTVNICKFSLELRREICDFYLSILKSFQFTRYDKKKFDTVIEVRQQVSFFKKYIVLNASFFCLFHFHLEFQICSCKFEKVSCISFRRNYFV